MNCPDCGGDVVVDRRGAWGCKRCPAFCLPLREMPRPGYGALAAILDEALEQAQNGKGRQRHERAGTSFEDQHMVRICEALGSSQFAIGQALKKLEELASAPLSPPQRRAELLGVIIYAAGALLVEDRERARREKGPG